MRVDELLELLAEVPDYYHVRVQVTVQSDLTGEDWEPSAYAVSLDRSVVNGAVVLRGD